jgi:type I restriction enzyme S subunit
VSYPLRSIGELESAGAAKIQTGPFGTQLKASDYTPVGVPVINVRNIGYGELRAEKLEYVPDNIVDKLKVHVLSEDDIVFGRKGAVDRHLFVGKAQSGWLQGSDCIRLRLDSNRLYPRYLSYAFLTAHHKEWMLQQCANKATMASLNQDVIRRIQIPVPKRNQQLRIVSILATYDDLIENNRRRIALLEEAARLLYREWFVHFRFPGHEHAKIIDGLPEGWRWRQLGNVVHVVKGSVKPADFTKDDIHIGLEHIPRRSFTLADWELAEGLASSKTRFAAGDILFCKIRPYFHKVGFTLRSGLASSDAIVWRVRESEDWPLVVCATSSDHFVAVASKTVREGSKMPRADDKVLLGYPIPKPPEGLLSIFNNSILPITQQCKTLALQSRALAQARDLLLPRLMNGEIAV